MPAALDPKALGQPAAQAFEGELAVAQLRALVAGHHPHGWAEALEQARLLAGPERS